jgi:hypothetical protein
VKAALKLAHSYLLPALYKHQSDQLIGLVPTMIDDNKGLLAELYLNLGDPLAQDIFAKSGQDCFSKHQLSLAWNACPQ